MCGFVAAFGKNLPTTNEIEYMTSMILHRGPDEGGYYQDRHIKLGFRRLSIIDIENGKQPLSFENNRYIIVYNGEIYNYLELRHKLECNGLSFETESDTEMIVALYSLYKERSLNMLRGMFSFVIWDKYEKEIFAARDYFGIKPFFYSIIHNTLFMSSEAKTIYEMEEELEVSSEALQHYLTFQYYPEPNTAIATVKKLRPGSFMKKKINQELKIYRYWQPHFSPSKDSYTYQRSRILDVLRESVKKHMRSDVPVGAFLSGGIDSTAIVALARETNPHIKTFSIGFEKDGFSEIDVAKETAEKLKIENYRSLITAEQYLHELPKIIWHMDEPLADPSAVPLYFLAREARKQVKVVLSGEGADELFGGYNIYREPHSLRFLTNTPHFMKKWLKHFSKIIPEGMKGKSFLERGCTELENRYYGNAKIMTETEKNSALLRYDKSQPSSEMTKSIFERASGYDDVMKMQYLDLHTWLQGDILVKADKMTMAHSLELRVPFLDIEVFKVASTLQTKDKITQGTTKYILRDAVKEIVPSAVLMRKKLGFPVPIRHWLRKEWYESVQKLIINSDTDHLFHKSYLLKMLESHRLHKIDYSRKLWTIIVFMIWHQIYIERMYTFKEATMDIDKETLIKNTIKALSS